MVGDCGHTVPCPVSSQNRARVARLRLLTGRALYGHHHLPPIINSFSLTCQSKIFNRVNKTHPSNILKYCCQVWKGWTGTAHCVEGSIKISDSENKQINNLTISLTYFIFYFLHLIRKSKACKITEFHSYQLFVF